MKKKRNRQPKYPHMFHRVRVTAAQYERLRETWLAGGPSIAEQIRRALDQAAGQKGDG